MTEIEKRIVDAVCARLFGGEVTTEAKQATSAPHPFVGKFCIVRASAAGVHAGIVSAVDGDTVTLEPNALRLYYWKANHSTGALHAVAKYGLSKESKVEKSAGAVQIKGVCELLEVAKDAIDKIAENWK